MASSSTLAATMDKLRMQLSPEEVENYKLLLCMAAGGLAPRAQAPKSQRQEQAFDTVLQCLESMRLEGATWRGRPAFLTDKLLGELQGESRRGRLVAKEPTAMDRYLLTCGGTVADKFATHPELVALVQERFPRVHPTGIASYIYYDGEEHGLDPHVDTEVYAVNVILMLDHEYTANPSHLLVYENGAQPEKILLKPGDMLILNAGCVVHAREDMGPGEKVGILTIGFGDAD